MAGITPLQFIVISSQPPLSSLLRAMRQCLPEIWEGALNPASNQTKTRRRVRRLALDRVPYRNAHKAWLLSMNRPEEAGPFGHLRSGKRWSRASAGPSIPCEDQRSASGIEQSGGESRGGQRETERPPNFRPPQALRSRPERVQGRRPQFRSPHLRKKCQGSSCVEIRRLAPRHSQDGSRQDWPVPCSTPIHKRCLRSRKRRERNGFDAAGRANAIVLHPPLARPSNVFGRAFGEGALSIESLRSPFPEAAPSRIRTEGPSRCRLAPLSTRRSRLASEGSLRPPREEVRIPRSQRVFRRLATPTSPMPATRPRRISPAKSSRG